MAQSKEDIENKDLMQEDEETSIFKDVDKIKSSEQFKQEIGRIANAAYQKGFISRESYEFYTKLAYKNSSEDNSEMLESMYKYSGDQYNKAQTINSRFDKAIKSGYMSEKDKTFLMSKIVHQPEFVSNFSKADQLVNDKIDRMKKDREGYDQIANHKLVKNVGYLKIDKNTKIDIPNEKKFLELTVPERRELLQKIKEALPKAEKYAEAVGDEESKELTDKYGKMLNNAYTKKIIGKDTYDKFLDGFKKVDKTEKEYWISEFGNEMKRYENLWGNIRSTLKGDALDKMEGMRDEKGYSELFAEFGKVSTKEKKRLDKEYGAILIGFQQDGTIGRHTLDEFTDWMTKQELGDKYKAAEKLHDGEGGQIERYKKLNDDIDNNLSKKQQAYMESKKDDWGYTESKSQYDRFIRGEKVPDKATSGSSSDPLSVVQSMAVKRAIVDTDINLKKKGGEKRKTFLTRIKTMFSQERRDQFDASGFQSRLKNNREEKGNTPKQEKVEGHQNADVLDLQTKLREKRVQESRRNSEEVDRTGIEDEMRNLKESKKANVVDEEGFKQVQGVEDQSGIRRKAQVEINREKAMERFFVEDNKQQFRGKEQGGHDDLSLAVRAEGDRTVELNLTEIRAMEKYLEQKEKEDQEEERLDRAA